MSEIGLKLLLDRTSSGELWKRVKASDLADRGPTKKTFRSIYLDTPEHALKKAGIVLMLRRDGWRWVQSITTGNGLDGSLSQTTEIENAAPGGRVCLDAIPDSSVREEVLSRINGAPLQPVCEALVRRRTRELVLQDGTRAELALDIGEIRAAGRSAELSEVAIQLLAGNRSGLFDIAHMLLPEGGLRLSRLSKAARGYLLAEEGRIEAPPTPRNARHVALDSVQTAEQAACDILRECLDQIIANVWVVRQLDDPEGPHQLRVGLRRLRSVFSVCAPVLASPEMKRLGGEARWLGQAVGSLRDLDVVANDMVRREAEIHPDQPGLAALADVLLRQGAERREQVRKLLAGPRVQAFLIDLARFVETRGWFLSEDFGQSRRVAAPVLELAGQGLEKRWKKVRKHARGLKTLTVEQRHELRKELKKLRYAVEFFSSLFPAKRVDPFLKRLKKLQAIFGDINDAATVKAMFAGTEVAGAGDPSTRHAMAWMIEACDARAEFGWTGAKGLWRDLERTRLFWK